MDFGSPVLKGLTVVLFAALAAAAFGVFVVLPQRVEERRQPRVEGQVEAAPVSPALRGEPGEEPRQDGRPQPSNHPTPKAPPSLKGGNPQDDPFIQAMSDGLAALDRQDFAAAEDAFKRAERLRPRSPEAADGLLRAAAGRRRTAVAGHRLEAASLEDAEEWVEAIEHYDAVLAIDATVVFAQEGRRRAAARSEIAERLEVHAAQPSRLSDDAVLREAADLLDRAAEVSPAGPRHRRQTEVLRGLVDAWSTPVRAVLRSDQATEVVVYKVGRLGSFAERVLELRPGTYTVVGSRRGYRDVRRQLVVEPGREPAPLTVRCEEEI
jgi:tetratricopeptide (TPR) repeat protein